MGLAGAEALAPSSSCLVAVDVLSFSTSVTVAAEAGTRIYPYPWRAVEIDVCHLVPVLSDGAFAGT